MSLDKQFFPCIFRIVSRFTATIGQEEKMRHKSNVILMSNGLFSMCPCAYHSYLVLLAKRLNENMFAWMDEWTSEQVSKSISKCAAINRVCVRPLNNNENVCIKITITRCSSSDGRFLFGDSFDSIEIKFKYTLIDSVCARDSLRLCLARSYLACKLLIIWARQSARICNFEMLLYIYISPTSIIFCLVLSACLRSPLTLPDAIIYRRWYVWLLPANLPHQLLTLSDENNNSQTPFVQTKTTTKKIRNHESGSYL